MLLIVFEGIDGAGKTTLINEVARGLQAQNYQVQIVTGLGSSTIGAEIRQMFLTNPNLNALTKYHLSLGVLKQIQAEILQPLMNTETVVLMDRYLASNYAYQAHGAYLSDYHFDYQKYYLDDYNYAPKSKTNVDQFLNRFQIEAAFLPTPNFTFYLDIKAAFAKRRLPTATDAIESKDVNYFSLVQTHFEEYFAANNSQSNLLFLKGIDSVLENYQRVVEIINQLTIKKGN